MSESISMHRRPRHYRFGYFCSDERDQGRGADLIYDRASAEDDRLDELKRIEYVLKRLTPRERRFVRAILEKGLSRCQVSRRFGNMESWEYNLWLETIITKIKNMRLQPLYPALQNLHRGFAMNCGMRKSITHS